MEKDICKKYIFLESVKEYFLNFFIGTHYKTYEYKVAEYYYVRHMHLVYKPVIQGNENGKVIF